MEERVVGVAEEGIIDPGSAIFLLGFKLWNGEKPYAANEGEL